MKKRLAVLLSIIMLLGGCGLSNEQYKDADKESKEQTKIEEDSSFLEESVAEDNNLCLFFQRIERTNKNRRRQLVSRRKCGRGQ